MFKTKKLITLIVAISFALQGCSRGVAPTEGNFNFVDANPDDPQIVNDLCAQTGDTDSNYNLVCDSQEESSSSPETPEILLGNQKSWFARSGWWQMLGLAGMGVGTYFLVRDNKKNGKYWLKEPTQENVIAGQNALGAGVYLSPRNNNGSVEYTEAGSTNRFYSGGGTRHFIQKNISKVNADLVYHTGNMSIKHGGKMLNCIHGAQLGVAQDPSDSKRLLVSMYFKEDYIKESTRIADHVSQAQFFNYCDQNTGTFSATQTVEGVDNFWVISANPGAYAVEKNPSGTLQGQGYKSGLTMALKFEADLPGDNVAGNLTTIRYFIHHPAHPNDELMSSKDFQVNGVSDVNGTVTSTQLDFSGQTGNEAKFLWMAQSNVKATAEIVLEEINAPENALSTNP